MIRKIAVIVTLCLLVGNVCFASDILKAKQTLGKDGVVFYWFHAKSNWMTSVTIPTEQKWLQIGAGPVISTQKIPFINRLPLPVEIKALVNLKFDTSIKRLPVTDIVPDIFATLKEGRWKAEVRALLEVDPRGKENLLLFSRDYIQYQLQENWTLGIQGEYKHIGNESNFWLGPCLEHKTSKGLTIYGFWAIDTTTKSPWDKLVWWELKVRI